MSDYFGVKFKISPYSEDAADLLAAFLADAGFDSFETSDDTLTAYIPASNFDEKAIALAVEALPFRLDINWESSLIPHCDWNEEWEKNYFKPLSLGNGRCVVHSSFHTDYPQAEFDITIDPRMAFGTGHHATTSMMANHLFSNDLKGKKILDMGTGTGILAILAAKLGAREITGIEIDEGAFDNAVENCRLNEAEVRLIHGDASKLEGVSGINVFLANINRNIILADLDKYIATLDIDGKLILSGFYASDIPLIQRALEANGMEIIKTETEEGDWSSIISRKIS